MLPSLDGSFPIGYGVRAACITGFNETVHCEIWGGADRVDVGFTNLRFGAL